MEGPKTLALILSKTGGYMLTAAAGESKSWLSRSSIRTVLFIMTKTNYVAEVVEAGLPLVMELVLLFVFFIQRLLNLMTAQE